MSIMSILICLGSLKHLPINVEEAVFHACDFYYNTVLISPSRGDPFNDWGEGGGDVTNLSPI